MQTVSQWLHRHFAKGLKHSRKFALESSAIDDVSLFPPIKSLSTSLTARILEKLSGRAPPGPGLAHAPIDPVHLRDQPEVLVVRLAQLGDESAYAELVRRYQNWLIGLMRRLSGDPSLADDLAQIALLQVWRQLNRLRDPHKFAAWLKKVAVNTWLKHIRSRDPLAGAHGIGAAELDPQVAFDGAASSIGDPQQIRDLAMDLERALADLNSDARLCLVLAYHEGMSHREIAEATDIPLGSVKSHIARSLPKLKASLGVYDTSVDTRGIPDQPGAEERE